MAFIKRLLILLIPLVLYGCGTTTTAPSNLAVDANELSKKTELVSTSKYIPKQKTNRKGELIPYEPEENPYLRRGPSIKKVHLALYLAAKRAYDQNKWDESETLLQDLVSETDRLSGPWVMLGDIAMEKNQLTAAHERLTQAISINDKNVNAYLRLAKVQRLQGNFVEAQHTYAKALFIWPDFPEAHLNLGVLYDIYLNDPVKAREHMQAYQFLTEGKNKEVNLWIKEIEERAGISSDEGENILAQVNEEITPSE